MAENRELLIVSNGYQCMIEVTAADTFEDVRAKILQDFDNDMLPAGNQDFSISVNDVRLSRKQESRKSAWDITTNQNGGNRGVIVHLQAKGKRPATEVATSGASVNTFTRESSNDSRSPPKKTRTEKDKSSAGSPIAASLKEDEDSVIARISPSILEESPSLAAAADSTETNGTDLTGNNLSLTDKENTLDMDVSEKDDGHDVDVEISKVVVAHPENPNTKFDEAVASSRTLLRKLTDVLDQPENENFCIQARRKEWKAELTTSLEHAAPDTTIGVLGNTGVG
ncbi:MAG: hypothetical protein SGILL_006561 [Bacillariaceae sp.]